MNLDFVDIETENFPSRGIPRGTDTWPFNRPEDPDYLKEGQPKYIVHALNDQTFVDLEEANVYVFRIDFGSDASDYGIITWSVAYGYPYDYGFWMQQAQ